MSKKAKEIKGTQRSRQHKRAGIMYPVEMVLYDERGDRLKPILQGFTEDISFGGLCVKYYSLQPEARALLTKKTKYARIDLQITVPYKPYLILAQGQVRWFELDESFEFPQARFGIEFKSIELPHRKLLVAHIRSLRYRRYFVVGLVGVLLVTISMLLFRQHSLLERQKQLIGTIVTEAEMREVAMTKLDEVATQEKMLSEDLRKEEKSLALVSMMMGRATLDTNDQKLVEAQLSQMVNGRMELASDLEELNDKKIELRKFQEIDITVEDNQQIASELYSWLHLHTNNKTGLVPSYEGDRALENVGFTYDQSLMAISHTLMGAPDKAAQILRFYKNKAKRSKGGFLNAYHTVSGNPTEWTVHVGPNIWVGIAAMQYQNKTRNDEFLTLAKSIGGWLLKFQALDGEGGIKGGPDVTWYSTEHNLDAYAYFGMLHKTTGEQKYLDAQASSLKWILKNAASISGNRFHRGKGDATIATDTFSWAIAALGPKVLSENNFDPEGIMEFAEEHCRVKVKFERPDGKIVSITGFDFSKPEHVARGGVVSAEWTAQAIVTYRILAKYYALEGQRQKSKYHAQKANFFLNELQKMIISSLSRVGQGKGCLPYATQADVATGHGWRTPAGNRTGSVAGTAYGMFAWYDFNPFQLDETL